MWRSYDKLFYKQIKSGFDFRSGLAGAVCQFTFPGGKIPEFHIRLKQKTVRYAKGRHPNPTVSVAWDAHHFVENFAGLSRMDFRNSKIIKHIDVTGYDAVWWEISKFIKRPPDHVRKGYKLSEKKAKHLPRPLDVARIANPSDEVIREHLWNCKPLIATDCLKGWDILSWRIADLRKRFGHLDCYPGETLGQFLDSMEQKQPVYTGGCPLAPEMDATFQLPFLEPEAYWTKRLWMGWESSDEPVTTLHRDPTPGFLIQIMGSKHIVLYSPDQSKYLYPHKSYNYHQPCWSRPWKPNYSLFPRLKKAWSTMVHLQPGEVFIRPTGWYHYVYARGAVLSVSRTLAPDYLKKNDLF